MIIDNCYVVTPETAEEVKLANEAILKYREQRMHDQLILRCKSDIFFEINRTIDKLGLAETKRIVRELARELRELGLDE